MAYFLDGDLILESDKAIDFGTFEINEDTFISKEEVGTISGTLQNDIDTHQHDETDITDLDKYTQAEVDAKITTISGQLDDHDEMNNLDYASAGHTGFQESGDYATNTDLATVSGLTDTNASDIAVNEVNIATLSGSMHRINFETIVLDGTDISNKYMTLAIAPQTSSGLELHVYGGLKGKLDTDYTVSGTNVSWDGKNWDSVLEADDSIDVVCYY